MSAMYTSFPRKMTKGGYKRKGESGSYVLVNADLIRIAKTTDLKKYVEQQQLKYVCKVVNKVDNTSIVKQLMFNSDKSKKTVPKTTLLTSVLRNEQFFSILLFVFTISNRKNFFLFCFQQNFIFQRFRDYIGGQEKALHRQRRHQTTWKIRITRQDSFRIIGLIKPTC